MKRWVLIWASTAALLAFPAGGEAQSLKERGLMLWQKMMGPVKNLDSTYVFQPFKGWNVATVYQGRWDGVKLEIPLEVEVGSVTQKGIIHVNLVDNQTHHVGFRGGYGPIELGYSFAVGAKEKPDRNFSFNWLSTLFGLQFYYSRMHDKAISTLEFEGLSPSRMPEVGSSAGILRLSGFYIFNHKKFSYPSAYQGKLVQRKSAGSFMAGAKYYQANLALDNPKNILGALTLNLTAYRAYQFSLGAGYSYNWVLYHRDAQSMHELGKLRNLTFNITAIPLLTFVNEMRMVHLLPRGEGEEIIPAHGGIQPNAMGRVGLCYAFGHFYINSCFDFYYHHIRSKELTTKNLQKSVIDTADYIYRLSVLGNLFNWTAGVELHYRF